MKGLERILLFFVLTNSVVAVSCTTCEENCNQIWANGTADNDTIFSTFKRNNPDDNIYIVNWQWNYNSVGKWNLYYKEWPRKATQTGGFVLTMRRRQIIAKLDWKAYNGMIVWTSIYRQPFEYTWNATICALDLPIKFESNMRGWRFHLGKILLTGNKSGILRLNGTSLLNYEEEEDQIMLNRKKRETDELSENEKKTVWNKIKGYFKELYDQGDDDHRTWLKRLGDWVLGFLERILT
ncbi:uncharacterized protein [Halyomorpha halys]|uniref:uncharacterized protein isoform X2 n=1 Tax=Halyomorpha halys TaxID=286706 RepID=UPI0006D5123B|nr:uncharacterized protein LOC106685767 isoform X2 [Halyomorpha halys]